MCVGMQLRECEESKICLLTRTIAIGAMGGGTGLGAEGKEGNDG